MHKKKKKNPFLKKVDKYLDRFHNNPDIFKEQVEASRVLIEKLGLPK